MHESEITEILQGDWIRDDDLMKFQIVSNNIENVDGTNIKTTFYKLKWNPDINQ